MKFKKLQFLHLDLPLTPTGERITLILKQGSNTRKVREKKIDESGKVEYGPLKYVFNCQVELTPYIPTSHTPEPNFTLTLETQADEKEDTGRYQVGGSKLLGEDYSFIKRPRNVNRYTLIGAVVTWT
jgi:hypothetical protein